MVLIAHIILASVIAILLIWVLTASLVMTMKEINRGEIGIRQYGRVVFVVITFFWNLQLVWMIATHSTQ